MVEPRNLTLPIASLLSKFMRINDLPQEILTKIVTKAMIANRTDGVQYTYGLSQDVYSIAEAESSSMLRYVRGPLRDDLIAWDATSAIRRVCSRWGLWVTERNFEQIRIQLPLGRERWAGLTSCRSRYALYELINDPRGTLASRDQHQCLRNTIELIHRYSAISQYVKRLWFDGFYTADTDKWILAVAGDCPNLERLTVPWTAVRRGTPEQWMKVLKAETTEGTPLRSLGIRSAYPATNDETAPKSSQSTHPLRDSRVNFSQLHQPRLSGNCQHLMITDDDLSMIARTAVNLDSIQINASSSISIAGVDNLLRSSRASLKLLQYRPLRNVVASPSFGSRKAKKHVCRDLSALPSVCEVDVSIPSICADLFTHHGLGWRGVCLISFEGTCLESQCPLSQDQSRILREGLGAARLLIQERNRLREDLVIELANDRYFFEPAKRLVHMEAVSVFGMMNLESIQETSVSAEGKVADYFGSTTVTVTESRFFEAVKDGNIVL